MKTIETISIIMLAAAFCACQKENQVTETPDGTKMIEVRAVFADGELSSKASLADGSTQFEWNASDKVVAWNGSKETTNCGITNIDANGVATFSIPAGSEWVIYPSAALTVSSNTATWTRPVGQTVSGSGQLIGDGANPMFGRVNGDEVEFTNLCGYIQFKFTGTKTLTKFSFKSNNISSNALTGKGSINVSAATPVLSYPKATGGNNIYGYTNVSGLNLPLDPTTPTPVMVVLPPATYEGAEIILEFNDGTSLTIISNNDLTVTRNTVFRVKNIDVDSRIPDSSIALDAGGRSNCYMLEPSAEGKYYSFKASSITGDVAFDLAKTANILWAESKSLINNISYDSTTKRVTFKYMGGNLEGNAIVALDQNLQNAASTLLWNYHIWVTDKPADVSMNDTGLPVPVMDRNVGATWAPKTTAEVTGMTADQWLETVGTYYQYGNHIPYPRIARIDNSSAAWDNARIAIQYGFSNYCHTMKASTAAKTTLADQETMANYLYQKGTGTNYGTEENPVNETIWTTVKIKGSPKGDGYDNIWITPNGTSTKQNDYDPCPQGYVFIGATHLYRLTSNSNNKVKSQTLNSYFSGKYHSNTSGDLLYYPAAGYLGQGKAALVGGINDSGRVVYWSYYTGNDMNAGLFRRAIMESGSTTFGFGNVPFSSQAHNMRCARLK
ncbi:MAG: hypothetical protein J5640_02285 [Bacteroidales bacterium]|nr:hypothetical protein [Bacteroidales bacterium]